MALRPSFVKRPVATAPQSGPVRGPEAPPLRSGQLYISNDVAKELEIFGRKPDDPVPEGLAAVIADVRKRYTEAQAEVAAVGQKPRIGPVKSISLKDLPDAAKQEIQDYLDKAVPLLKAAEARASQPTMVPENATPQVREALERYEQNAPLVTIEDDDEPPAKEEPAKAQEPAVEEPKQDPICPQCGYDCRVPFDVEITPEDTMAHIAAILDPSPTARFRKTAKLFDGKMIVVFRSLTTKEGVAARKQTRKDVIDGKIMGEAEYYMNYMEYRLAMSVESLLDDKGTPIVEIPPLAELAKDCPEGTDLLPWLVEWMDENCYDDESLKRSIGKHHRTFQHLVEALEAQEADPNFCRGIATQP